MNLRLKKHRATGQQLLAQTGEILKQRFMHERKLNKGANTPQSKSSSINHERVAINEARGKHGSVLIEE